MSFDRKFKKNISKIYKNIFSPHLIFLLYSFLNKLKTTSLFFFFLSQPLKPNISFCFFFFCCKYTIIFLSFIIITLYLVGEVIKHNGSHKKVIPEFLKWPQESFLCASVFCFCATDHKTRTRTSITRKPHFRIYWSTSLSAHHSHLLLFTIQGPHCPDSSTPLLHPHIYICERSLWYFWNSLDVQNCSRFKFKKKL